MISRWSIGVGVMAMLASAMVALPTAAKTGGDPEPPTSSAVQGREYGSAIRAEFRQNYDGSGYYLAAFGSGPCTPSTATPDVSFSVLPGRWNDSASWATDYNRCDIKIYRDGGFTGPSWGYTNFASGRYLGDYWNDEMSSYRLS